MRFFGEGSHQLKLFWASLAVQSGESNGRPFSQVRIKRIVQREKVAISNRLPIFLIGADSGRFLFPAGSFLEQLRV
ncbi:hypothetical protein AUI46_00535 [archaeon 13_1_40CM_2_52_13]|nr:MAG: hypothetical protein AUI46_00535 [archaeon 13_1_40CM_2_52_13]